MQTYNLKKNQKWLVYLGALIAIILVGFWSYSTHVLFMGLFIILFIGVPFLVIGFKAISRDPLKNLLRGTIVMAISIVVLWLGSEFIRGDFYSPSISFLNSPTKIIRNHPDVIPYFGPVIAAGGVIKSKETKVGLGVNYLWQTNYLTIDVGGMDISFDASKQIYNIFKSGDKVDITYKLGGLKYNLKTITLSD